MSLYHTYRLEIEPVQIVAESEVDALDKLAELVNEGLVDVEVERLDPITEDDFDLSEIEDDFVLGDDYMLFDGSEAI